MKLLEGLFAIFLIGLVVGALFNFYPLSALAVDQAGHRIQAENLASSTMAKERGVPFDKLVPGRQELEPVQRENVTYRPSLEIFTIPGRDPQHLKGVRVTVQWAERSGPRQVAYELWLSSIQH